MLCKWRLMLGRKDTTGSSLGMAGQLCYTTGGEREVGGTSRIHGGKIERAGCKGREGERSSDGRMLRYQVENN
jgi:hypothetical protein